MCCEYICEFCLYVVGGDGLGNFIGDFVEVMIVCMYGEVGLGNVVGGVMVYGLGV